MIDRRLRRWVARACAGLLAVALAAWSTTYVVAWWWYRSEEHAWVRSLGGWDAFVRAAPSQPTSPAALRLDELTRALGFPMIEYGPEDGAGPFKVIAGYVREVSETPYDRLESPPPEVTVYLDPFRSPIDAIEAHLVVNGPIAWQQSIDEPDKDDLSRMLGHCNLQGILLARAFTALRHGEPQTAARSLEASWRLNESNCARSDWTSEGLCRLFAGWQNAVLRRLRDPAPSWDKRLDRDFRASTLRVCQREVYAFRAQAQVLLAPYRQLTIASHTRYVRRIAARLSAGDACAQEFSRLSEEERPDALARWHPPGRMTTVQNLFRLSGSALVSSLDDEQTRIIMGVRRRHHEGGSLADFPNVPSAVCPGVVWRVQAGDGGHVRVAPDREPLGDRGARQSWTYTLTLMK